jgi:hypothetical protein
MSAINSYFTDQVVVVSVTVNQWGVITEADNAQEAARVEDYNRLILDSNGKEVMGNILIFLDKNSTIKTGDKIKLKTKNGIAYEQPDKKFQIKKINAAGMFKKKFIEIIV